MILRYLVLTLTVVLSILLTTSCVVGARHAFTLTSHRTPIKPPYPLLSHNGSFMKHLIKTQFRLFDPSYDVERAHADAVFAVHNAKLLSLQRRGYGVPCSYQIATEVAWRIHHTAGDWSVVSHRLMQLNASLSNPDAQIDLGKQSSSDGSWSPSECSDILWVKLGASQDGLYPYHDNDTSPPYPLTFIENTPLSSIDTLIPHLEALWVSDIVNDGVDRRTELSNILTFVSKMVELRDWLNRRVTGYHIDDDYAQRYLAFLDTYQSLTTGYWGAQYVNSAKPSPTINVHSTSINDTTSISANSPPHAEHIRTSGHDTDTSISTSILSTDDLSMTFHITKYRFGNISHPLALARNTLAIRDSPYPYGWGNYTGYFDNHNSFDVVSLLSFTFNALPPSELSQAQHAVVDMLNYTLSPTSMTRTPTSNALVCANGEDSLGDCYYFGVGMLEVCGVWNQTQREWWSPSSPVVHPLSLCKTLVKTMVNMGAALQFGIGATALRDLRALCSS